eukprot:38002-Prymnesium_polylepis.1
MSRAVVVPFWRVCPPQVDHALGGSGAEGGQELTCALTHHSAHSESCITTRLHHCHFGHLSAVYVGLGRYTVTPTLLAHGAFHLAAEIRGEAMPVALRFAARCPPEKMVLPGTDLCACQPGYSWAQQTDGCSPCDINYFKEQIGNAPCTQCPMERATTLALGATNESYCKCVLGYFMSAHVNFLGARTCDSCMEGSNCTQLGETLEELPLLRGYWRSDAASTKLLGCAPAKACVGGVNLSAFCEVGYWGPTCGICEDGYFRNGQQDTCDVCASDNVRIILVWFLVVPVAMCLIFGALMYFALQAVSRAFKAHMDAMVTGQESCTDLFVEASET